MPDSKPRVAIGPMDAAGCGAALAAGLRDLGVDAEVAVSFAHPFGYLSDRVLDRRARVRYALWAARRRDVLHYQFGRTWTPGLTDARLARMLGVTIVMTFHGDDCRLYGLTRALFPAQATYALVEDDAALRRRLQRLAGVCHAAVVKDLELAAYVYPFFDRTYVSPIALYPAAVVAGKRGDRPIVLHAPSDPRYKGTAIVESALSSLRSRRTLDFHLATGVTHDVVQDELSRADIVVDQLNSVAIGVFALEAMRAGLPVLAEYDPRALAPYQADVPVVRVTLESLEEEVEALIDDAGRRRELGEQGREYVDRVHAPVRVAEAALQIYEHARDAEPGLYEATAEGIRQLDAIPADERARRRSGQPLSPLVSA